MFQLRPYQQECLSKIKEGFKNGITKQLLNLCTGAGKTVIFSQLPEHVKNKTGKKTLVLAHREELLEQALNKISAISPTLKISIEQGINTCDIDSDVIIASVQTLGRNDSDRIKKLNPDDFGCIIIDETHRATSMLYQNILSYFGVNKQEDVCRNDILLLGVTATPNRTDGEGLGKVFDEIIFKYGIRDAIKDGYLCSIKAYSIFTNADLTSVSTARGDYVTKELAEAVDTTERNELIVNSYEKVCKDEYAIIFCVNVEHCVNLTAMFQGMGYNADMVVGSTPKDERRDILKRFYDGEIKILLGVNIFIEGFDNPRISACLMARPTKSSLFYTQAIGRVLRLFENKDHAKVLDFADNTKNNSLITAASLIGVGKAMKFKGHDLFDTEEKINELLDNKPRIDLSTIDLDNIDTIIKEVDIFSMSELSDEIKALSNNAWQIYKSGYKISLGTNSLGVKIYGEIKQNLLDKWEVCFYELDLQEPSYLNKYKKYQRKDIKGGYSVKDSKENAIKLADKYIEVAFSAGQKAMVNQKAKWRTGDVTDKQKYILKKNGFKEDQIVQLTKGEASNLISKIFNS